MAAALALGEDRSRKSKTRAGQHDDCPSHVILPGFKRSRSMDRASLRIGSESVGLGTGPRCGSQR